jgi:hypothetical protein
LFFLGGDDEENPMVLDEGSVSNEELADEERDPTLHYTAKYLNNLEEPDPSRYNRSLTYIHTLNF